MASENPEKKFLYDIIYCDRTRLIPLISQLNAHGLPKDIVVTENAGSRGALEAGGTAGWSFAAKAEAKGKIAADISESTSQETQYDPYWATVLAFADQAVSLAKRDDFEIGRLCLVSGSLSAADVSSLRDLMKTQLTREGMMVGLMPDGSVKTSDRKEAKKTYDSLHEVITLYSGLVQGILKSGEDEYWMSLEREHLSFSAEEIILKFGSIIPGNWSILGIYDSAPAVTQDVDIPEDGGIQAMIMGIAPIVRNLVGKKDTQHSITPLMIMREI